MFKEGQVWRSEDNPEKSFEITYIAKMFENNDESDENLVICWSVADDPAWSKHVCAKKNVKSIDDLLKSGRNTYPFAFAGEMSAKTAKAKIRKYKMFEEVTK